MSEEPKNKILEAVAAIEKRYGKGAVIALDSVDNDIERVSSGSLGLDQALGGGYPRGRIVEIFGPESSGKSTLALHAIAEVHAMGGVAAYIDTEHAFDKQYAENLGVITTKDRLLFSQPDNGEQALEITEILVRTGEIDIVVIDSVAALTPAAEIDGDMGDSKMGLQARLMSQALRKLVAVIGKTNCIVLFINQLREKIGVSFGNPETTTGGNALKFYASQRLDIRRTQINKDGEESVSNTVKVKIVKNKVAPPFRVASFNIEYGKGIDKLVELINLAVDFKVINKSGSWFSYGETRLGQGIDAVKQILSDNPELVDELSVIVCSNLKK